jgi:hypothetical protein
VPTTIYATLRPSYTVVCFYILVLAVTITISLELNQIKGLIERSIDVAVNIHKLPMTQHHSLPF